MHGSALLLAATSVSQPAPRENALREFVSSTSNKIRAAAQRIGSMSVDEKGSLQQVVVDMKRELDKLSSLEYCGVARRLPHEERYKAVTSNAFQTASAMVSAPLVRECSTTGATLESQEPIKWALSRLNVLVTSFRGTNGHTILQEAYSKGVDRLLLHLSDLLTTTEGELRDLTLESLENKLMFLLNMNAFITGSDFQDVASSFDSLSDRLLDVKTDIARTITDCFESLEVKPLEVGEFDTKALGEARCLLLAVGQRQSLCEVLLSTHSSSCLVQRVSNFDANIIATLHAHAEHIKMEVESLLEKEASEQTLQLIKKEVDVSEEKIGVMRMTCNGIRGWSQFESKLMDPTLEVLIEAQSELELYGRGLQQKAVELARGHNQAICSAKNFLCRAQSREDGLASLLLEISKSENWDVWVSMASKKYSVFHTVKSFFGLGQVNGNELAATMVELVSELQHQIWASVEMLYRRLHRSEDPMQICRVLLEDSSEDVSVLLALVRISGNSNLPNTVLAADGRGHLEPLILKAMECVRRGFLTASELPGALFQSRHFEMMGELLCVWRDSPVWEVARALVMSPIPASSSLVASLKESIDHCPRYESICKDTLRAIKQLEKEVENVSFDAMLDYSDMRTLDNFYHSIAVLFDSVSNVSTLAAHLPTPEQGGASSMSITASEIAQYEIDKIEAELLDLASSIMQEENQFVRIHQLEANLASIESSFADTQPRLAAAARNARREAKRRVDAALKDIIDGSHLVMDRLIANLLKLKKASCAILRWRDDINKCIDTCLVNAIEFSSGPNYVLGVALSLRQVEGDSATWAQQILSDHSCFDGVMNAIFNEATSGQGIDYVLGRLDLSAAQSVKFRSMYESFEQSYMELVSTGLGAQKSGDDAAGQRFLEELVDATRTIANDFSTSYSEQQAALTSHLFAYWSLTNSNQCAQAAQSSNEVSNYLMKPHAAQVVAIWAMLNCAVLSDGENIPNHLVELKTGEGKSIVLGIAATILGLQGYETDCVCYSCFLSNRDFLAFCDIFETFGVSELIWYGTIKSLCEKLLDSYRVDADNVIQNNTLTKARSPHSNRPRVMLVDEVDVFFKDDVHGKSFRPVAKLPCPDFMLFVWKNCEHLSSQALMASAEAQQVIAKYPSDTREFLRNELRGVLRDAKLVKGGGGKPYTVTNGMIGYKYFDELTMSHNVGYQTVFAYVKECEAGRVTTRTRNHKLFLKPQIGRVSLAELPCYYDVVLGVTGTLRGLGAEERNILESCYSIANFTYIPSVYGDNKLKFAGDSEDDVVLSDGQEDHFLDLKQEIIRRQGTTDGTIVRAVMVFFDSAETLLACYDTPVMSSMKTKINVVTEATPAHTKNGLFLKATEQSQITFMIREFGRGTDFKCYDRKMLQTGGVHVIQAFFSTDSAEEIQIKGRCARQGADGSFSMVINTHTLRELGISSQDVQKMKARRELHSFLSKQREANYGKTIEKRKARVRDLEDFHYRTMACKEAMLRSSARNRRSVIQFIGEQNGCGDSNAFKANELKSAMLVANKTRLVNHAQKRDEQRRKARRDRKAALTLETTVPETKRLRVRELLKTQSVSHYELLDVTKDATSDDVARAYRSLALLFHPDKCQDDNANEIFRQIKAASDVLSCDERRAAYDAEQSEGTESDNDISL